jgi:N-hydroxyarylamine O-acetyltransferase
VSLSDGDLAAYFQRIGWEGAAAPDRATLAGLVAAHTAAIAFENLDPFLGRPVELAPEALVAKLIRDRRGGYCYEQNGLFRHVLETIGFSVTGLGARVLWMQPDDALTPRSHMVLLVDLPEGPVIADVGFGGAVLTGVLDLIADVPQPTPHERFRLLRRDGEWRQQVEVAGEWRTTYRFDLHPQLAVDYEVINWWTSAHPRSHFTQGLIAARALPGRRLALRNLDYAVHPLGGETQRRRLADPNEVCDVLEEDFAIAVPAREALLARLRQLA